MTFIVPTNKEFLAYEQKENTVTVSDFRSWKVDWKWEWKLISTVWKESSITLADTEKTQVVAWFVSEKDQIINLQIKKIRKKKTKGVITYEEKEKIFFKIEDIQVLKNFLEFLLNFDLKSLSKWKIDLWENISFDENLIKKLSLLSKDEWWYKALKEFLENELTKEDVVWLWYRKKQLVEFKTLLDDNTKGEKDWQSFFEGNPRIFWYGLDYRYLWILQREANIWTSDLSGWNSPITDFVMWCKDFTVLVELKTPETKLFSNIKNRANSWRLSNDLMDATSQVLAQKADWQIKSQSQQFDKQWNPIKQKTIDPNTILIIWRATEYQWEVQESQIKKRTFELFRRDSRNIQILTYDELYDRAKFIVEWK